MKDLFEKVIRAKLLNHRLEVASEVLNEMKSKKMKIYISGKITGLPYDEVVAKFENAENMLCLGYEVVNPLKNGLPRNASWKKHIVRDIELLLECDAIYMLGDWMESKGAQIEYTVAGHAGILIHDFNS